MTGRIRPLGCVAAALLLICTLASIARASPFLSAEIADALSARSELLRSAGLTDADFLSFDSWIEANGLQLFEERLAEARAGGPWPHYMRGLIDPDGDRAAAFYGRAMAAAGTGELWLLSLEFIRYEQLPWAEAAFDELEKKILTGGGSAAPFLSQKLMLMGHTMAMASPKRADFCYTSAKKFDPNQPWWAYKRGGIDFPNNIITASPTFIVEAGAVIWKSWRAQIGLVCGLYRFLSVTLFIFICTVFFIFSIKYLTSGAHTIGDILFGGASMRIRTLSSVIVVLSVLFIGVLPAMWLIAFLICRFMPTAERKLLMFACAVLALTPLDPYISNFLRHSVKPNSAAAILDRVISEGYSDSLHNMAAHAAKNPGNYANHLALAVSLAKKGNYNAADEAINEALNLAPDDLITLMYAGNIAFFKGDIAVMERRLGDLLAKHPKSARGRYNLAQAYIHEGTFTASDMITEAAKIDATLIGNYMRENEHHYSGDAPPMRRVMQPAVSPAYFWSRLFVTDLRNAATAGPGGATIAGVSPIAVFALSALLFIMLAALNAALWNGNKQKARTFFNCRICGRLLCRKCRKGTVCADCYKASLDSSNSAATMYNLQKKLQDRNVIQKDVAKCALGILIPGSDQLYKGEKIFKPAMVMLLTSAIYAAYICAFTFRTYYPSVTVINPVYFAAPLLIYNFAALIRQLTGLASTLKRRAKMTPKV
ncbi:MAG: hypothetical protein FWC23_05635 [Chitinispirillia bacterium]|nr:hypothetical protein [Chitinispirillia bacterium]MCL2268649.1 hypothetical protein [Chitinispirillia bacterium]